MLIDLLSVFVFAASLGFAFCLFAAVEFAGDEEPWMTADLDEDPFENDPPTFATRPVLETVVVAIPGAEAEGRPGCFPLNTRWGQ